jgi:hypothetical protein
MENLWMERAGKARDSPGAQLHEEAGRLLRVRGAPPTHRLRFRQGPTGDEGRPAEFQQKIERNTYIG